jgi:hypothetical protein
MSQFSRVKLKKKRLPALVCGMALFGLIGFSSCSNQTDMDTEYVEKTEIVDYTQGLITEVEEVEKDQFKITDENVVATKEDSRIIATYLDGAIDTFTLEEVALVEGEENTDGYSRRSGMSSVLMGGMMGYFMGRSLSSPTSRSSYKNTSAYNKANTTTSSALKSTAKTTTTRTKRPSSGSSGHGSGKSTRSYGG